MKSRWCSLSRQHLHREYLHFEATWFIAILFLVIRPVSVSLGLLGQKVPASERRLISWFGIRGIGSLYYLMFVLNRGVPQDLTSQLISITLTTIAISIVVHGITVTPLMNWHQSVEEDKPESARIRQLTPGGLGRRGDRLLGSLARIPTDFGRS